MAFFETLRSLSTSSAAGIALLLACSGSGDDNGRGGTTDGGSGAGGRSGASGKGGGGNAGAAGGATGGASGSSGSSGRSGSGGKAGSGSGICGGLAGFTCESDAWCDYPNGAVCGATDATGTCRPRPFACTEDCPGVCACDGKFYCNECNAQQAGQDISDDRSCRGDGGAQSVCMSDGDCRPGLKCCYPCGQAGCENQCITPMPNGMCPLFP